MGQRVHNGSQTTDLRRSHWNHPQGRCTCLAVVRDFLRPGRMTPTHNDRVLRFSCIGLSQGHCRILKDIYVHK